MVNKLIELYNSDKSYEEIAIIVGKSKGWVSKQLKGHIIPRPAKAKQVIHETINWQTKEERDQLVIEMYTINKFGAHII